MRLGSLFLAPKGCHGQITWDKWGIYGHPMSSHHHEWDSLQSPDVPVPRPLESPPDRVFWMLHVRKWQLKGLIHSHIDNFQGESEHGVFRPV